MPYHLGKSSSCPASKPHAVLKDDGSVAPGGCHETKEKAAAHMRALYANTDAGDNMSRFETPWRTTRRLFALHSGQVDWYRIKNQHNGPTLLHIFDEIGYFGVTAGDLIKDLADISGPLEVHINSPGGEVDDGLAIYNTLQAYGDVTTVIDGIAASIASVIAMAGKEVLIAKQGKMMVHDGYAMAIGSAADLRGLAEHLDKTSDSIASIYAEHTGRTTEHWRQIMKDETWFYGQEAIDAGLATRFVGGNGSVAGSDWDMSVFLNADASTDPDEPSGKRKSRHGHGQQSDSHDEPGDKDGDGDGEGDEPDKDDDKRDRRHGVGEQEDHTILVVHADGHMEIWNWDAAAAYAKCHSASDFKSIAFEKSNDSDPATSAHYGLPHHASPGAGPDKGGVVAALGRANQVEGLKNKDAAIAHLKSHARSLGLPSGGGDDNSATTSIWDGMTDDQILSALKGA